jgi:hypothetical protein
MDLYFIKKDPEQQSVGRDSEFSPKEPAAIFN